ncbi:MAG: GNAT family N-acetyltransferase [Nanoarchaeota archaeon]
MELENLTLGSYEQHLQTILGSEAIFPETIRLDENQLIRILSGDKPIAKIAFSSSKYLGNVLGFCPSEKDIQDLELEGIVHDPKTLYLYNFVILPEFQGKGFGKALFQELVNAAKTQGYTFIEGHFRPNASLHIVKKEGAEATSIHSNWCNTGEEYIHCRLRI